MKTSKGCDDRMVRMTSRMVPMGLAACWLLLAIPTSPATAQNLKASAPSGAARPANSGQRVGARPGTPAQFRRAPSRRPANNGSVRLATANAGRAATPVVQQAIDQVYKQAAEATTVGDIQQALKRTQQLRSQTLDAENLAYVQQLQAWLLNRRGEAYAQSATESAEAGKDDDAAAQERQAQIDFTTSIDLNPHWRAFHNLGVSMAMSGEYDAAIEYFTESIALNSNYPNTRFNRAELWLELENFEAAEGEYSEVLKLSPEDVDSRIGRGHSRFYLGRFDEALADFDQVIKLQSDNASAYADRADLHAYLGNWKQAAEDYRQAIRIDKQLGRAYQSAAWLMATCPVEDFRDSKLALLAAEKAVSLDGTDDYRYLDTLAAAQANAGQFDEAATSLADAMKVAPQDVHGELQARMKLYETDQAFRDTAR